MPAMAARDGQHIMVASSSSFFCNIIPIGTVNMIDSGNGSLPRQWRLTAQPHISVCVREIEADSLKRMDVLV